MAQLKARTSLVTDREAFEAFYREHLGRVVRGCALVTLDPDAAEDIAAEAFSRLWAHWERIEDDDHAGGYVFKSAMRLCSRRRRASPEQHGEATPVTRSDPADITIDREDIAAALRVLPLRQRQAVVLRDWAGFSTSDIAGLLSMRESTVRVHLARGRGRLRGLLGVLDRE
jgi:RNA polymerase sigma-70 factor (ECF subfamily)